MNIIQGLDIQKVIEIILYIADKKPTDMYKLLKIPYFADKKHLSKYGRLIYDEQYIAMRLGPVPSGMYDIIKSARNDGIFDFGKKVSDAIEIKDFNIIPKRKPNLQYLSKSEIECLDEAIKEYGKLPFNVLKNKSHNDPAYKSADNNDSIALNDIIKDLPNSEQIFDYLKYE